MPFYSVRLHGQGILLPIEDKVAKGFYTTRFVRAQSADDACDRAKAMIAADWAREPYASSNGGSALRLEVETVFITSVWKWLISRNTGHAFYADD